MPGGGTGFEQLISPEEAPKNPEGKYVLECCMPGTFTSSSTAHVWDTMLNAHRGM